MLILFSQKLQDFLRPPSIDLILLIYFSPPKKKSFAAYAAYEAGRSEKLFVVIIILALDRLGQRAFSVRIVDHDQTA